MNQLLPIAAAICGLAGALISDARSQGVEGASDVAPLEQRWQLPWSHTVEDALRTSRVRGHERILVYARSNSFACRALERACGTDEGLGETLGRFGLLAVDVGDSEPLQDLSVPGTPFFFVVSRSGLADRLDDEERHPAPLGRTDIAPVGGLYDPIGLDWQLRHLEEAKWDALAGALDEIVAPPPDRIFDLALEASAGDREDMIERMLTEDLPLERDPNGPLHRYGRLREAVLTHTVAGPADAEGTIEAALLVEDDRRVLYLGWSLLASVFELRALAAEESASGTYRCVDAGRWNRRMREATREAWIACPDDLLVPFGAQLIDRYARSAEDLDTIDRLFCQAVVRTLNGEAPDHPRVQRAAEVVQTLR
ncbi:MAG: hypothetical protein AAGA20_15550 [Planctomycetota bacterium]